ncbi:tyrosine-protein phosphatase [Flavobacterium rhizosphaerae]|uniref:protein-tyrosine-phosphatase n=1 Tax=Flavobacterium rhizosphaerae TaxID=3163298 RepID=A0ABW8YXF2_9FLAO
MLFFKKPKITLAELIPDNYVDIHSHLLPGIDDGATDENHSLLLVNRLRELGFSQFITTPHVLPGVYNNTTEDIKDKEKLIASFYKDQGVLNPFSAAAEYLMDNVFLDRLATDPLLTLKDNHVLVEMSYINPPLQLKEIIFEIQMQGYKPVLAHPERYLFYHKAFDEYQKLKKAGCLFQLNLLSVTGYYGKAVLEIAKKLLDKNLIDFTGSDTHHERHIEFYKQSVRLKETEMIAFKNALQKNALFKLK